MRIIHSFLRALGRLPMPVQLGLPLLAFAGLLWLAGDTARASLAALEADDELLAAAFQREGIHNLIERSCDLARIVAMAYATVAVLAAAPIAPVLALIRHAYIGVGTALIYYAYVGVKIVATLVDTGTQVEGIDATPDRQFAWFCQYGVPAIVVGLVYFRLGLNAFRGSAVFAYHKSADTTPTPGDWLLAKVTGLLAQRKTRSVGLSFAIHFGILILPILLNLVGGFKPYKVPHGKGSPDAGGGAKKVEKGEEKRLVKVKLNKPKKKLRSTKDLKGVIFNPDAGKKIVQSLHAEALMEELDQLTELTHKANTKILEGGKGTGTGDGQGPGNKGGRLGKGGVGPGGWPEGTGNDPIRFVRLEYNGPDWDDGMSAFAGADINFLREFEEVTGFRHAPAGEALSAAKLKFVKKDAPPFLFMTGSGRINLSAGEMKTIREYLLSGGLLFADCGSPEWDRNFRNLIPSLLPGSSLVEISDDDGIFQAPFVFPNGAPPLWHHGGNRAMGVRHNGRWIVFYHPGDLNDAWKTGHSGLSPDKADAAMHVGINVLYYAFTQYLEQTSKQK